MAQLTVPNAQCIAISSPNGDLIHGQNIGLGNVYLGSDPGTNPNHYDKYIAPGGTFEWPGTNTLYVITDVGNNSGILSYSTNGATVNPGTTYVKSSNAPTLLYTSPIRVFGTAAAASVQAPLSPSIDVSAYASLIVLPLCGYGVFNTPVVTNWQGLVVEFADANGQNPNAIRSQWLMGDATSLSVYPQANSVQVPVKNKYARFQQLYGKAITALPGTFGYAVFGSAEVVPYPKYLNVLGDPVASYDGTYFSYYPNGTGANGALIASHSGPTRVSANADGTTAAGIIQLQRANFGSYQVFDSLDFRANANQNAIIRDHLFPRAPVSLFVTSSGTSGMQLSIASIE